MTPGMTPLATVSPAVAIREFEPPHPSPARPATSELWAAILAGGWGVRLRPLTRLICGDDRPKQYVTVTGSRSLLQHTLDRAALRIPAERTVVVSLEAQASHLAAAMTGHGAQLLLQPADRGTASGVLLPAHWVQKRAPEATMVFFPSDHLVLETAIFMDQVLEAAAFVDAHPGRILLLGAQATEAETEYGWIEAGPALDTRWSRVRAVRRFVEKPSPETARACLAGGASWNTFVFVAKVRTLVDAGRECVPRIHEALEQMVGGRPGAVRRAAAAMPDGNFSRDVLQQVAPRLAVRTLTGVTWCDWGSPRRVVASLARLGVRPAWLDQLPEPAVAGPGK
ncbi:MAG: sugar phosphate nucleotidyltransferase [Candidatus Rokuibacteriota bacterium]